MKTARIKFLINGIQQQVDVEGFSNITKGSVLDWLEYWYGLEDAILVGFEEV